jgi:hypothetical protein
MISFANDPILFIPHIKLSTLLPLEMQWQQTTAQLDNAPFVLCVWDLFVKAGRYVSFNFSKVFLNNERGG